MLTPAAFRPPPSAPSAGYGRESQSADGAMRTAVGGRRGRRTAVTDGDSVSSQSAILRATNQMGFFGLLFPWGVLLQALAIVHFIRRRPDTIWLWVIIFFGPIGALVYIGMEVIPDLGLLRQSFEGFGRRKRISHLEFIVRENPAPGNYEELGELYLDEGKWAKARECYDKAITSRSDIDPIYRRGIAEIMMADYPAAVRDLEQVTERDPKYDLHRAVALLAHGYANTGEPAKAEELFQQAVAISTISETYYNYATFLAAQGRTAEAREWAEKILAKKPTMPRYLQRRERPWFRKANALLKKLN